MKNPSLTHAHNIILGLIEGQRIAEGGIYQVLWIKDHFEIRKTNEADKDSFLIVKLFAKDINEGLRSAKRDLIVARVHTLIETGVIK